jgi:hypothetical protein
MFYLKDKPSQVENKLDFNEKQITLVIHFLFIGLLKNLLTSFLEKFSIELILAVRSGKKMNFGGTA